MKKNDSFRQVNIFGMDHLFPVGVMKRLDHSWAPPFRKLIFEKIDEQRFAGLYSEKDNRPNFPVNIWVALEIVKWLFDYTNEELLDQFHFNLLCSLAVGLNNLGSITLSERTVYYNRERLLDFEVKTGRNLLEEEFKTITDEVIAKLKLNTKIQRMDSTMIGSCIRQISRLELIAKVLQNFYGDLPEVEQLRWKEPLAEYIEEEAGHLSYRLKRAEVEDHLKRMGGWLFKLHEYYAYKADITQMKSYQQVGRLLLEQYNITVGLEYTQIEAKPAKEISPTSLQNPADDTATFNRQNGESHQRDILNIAETCHPENKVQLLTDVSLYTNNTADETMLSERIPQIKERTGVEQMITDGGFSGKKSESACQAESVILIPTEVKGRKLDPQEISLAQFHFEANLLKTCPEGYLPLEQKDNPEKGHHIVHFAKQNCTVCPQVEHCLVRSGKKCFSLIYNDRQLVLSRRRQQLGEEDYLKLCRLRPAVEGTVSQFKRKTRNGKLRIRLTPRIRNVAILMAMGINFSRLWAYCQKNQSALAFLLANSIILLMCAVFNLLKRLIIRINVPVKPFILHQPVF